MQLFSLRQVCSGFKHIAKGMTEDLIGADQFGQVRTT